MKMSDWNQGKQQNKRRKNNYESYLLNDGEQEVKQEPWGDAGWGQGKGAAWAGEEKREAGRGRGRGDKGRGRGQRNFQQEKKGVDDSWDRGNRNY